MNKNTKRSLKKKRILLQKIKGLLSYDTRCLAFQTTYRKLLGIYCMLQNKIKSLN